MAFADHAYDRTEIYLFEGMLDEAVESVDQADGYVREETLMKVTDLERLIVQHTRKYKLRPLLENLR